MKGIVFTELLDMAEQAIGEEAVDDILDNLELTNGGAFTGVGNYPCADLIKIVQSVSDCTGIPGEDLQRKFGAWMHGRFVQTYPQFFADKRTVLDMLDAIETEVHVEVRKLYPDAELPVFGTKWMSQTHLRMTYRSQRPLVSFCHGLIEACVLHFGQPARVEIERVSDNEAVFDVQLEQ
ncbi:heme NO-binding domain-containing protein [Antarctobacter jejuensis]|uniref:heme NO-binding domain-containing protein n=1 Tax=Antarctobacter jejuensis TaxID=1439938 RepID=UPI003FCFEFE7